VKFAVIADIHANQEALKAVLADIGEHGIERIICLGDIIGYGPQPLECLAIARKRFEFSLLGNHEYSVNIEALAGANEALRRSAEWTKQCLQQVEHYKLLKYIQSAADQVTLKPFFFVHASPLDPLSGSIIESKVAAENMARFPVGVTTCFVAHTHMPAIFVEGEEAKFLDEENRYKIEAERKCIINVGSVGQPRDKNPAACYVVVEDDVLTHRRIDYPFQETVAKIKAIPELDDYLADRLIHGS